MSWEEFELMPWKLGWKCEYWDGRAHITPRQHAICVVVEVRPRLMGPAMLRPVLVKDQQQLTSLFVQAFRDTIDYCDWSTKEIREAAGSSIDTFFSGQRGKPHASSRVAVRLTPRTKREQLVGAALIVEPAPKQPLLDILFVSPRARRRGVASALVGTAMNELHRLGIKRLESTYVMGNEESRAWHHEFGFVEEPDLLSMKLYYRHARHELQRHEKLHHLSESALTRLKRECAHWKREAERLEVVGREHGHEMVCPILRRAGRSRSQNHRPRRPERGLPVNPRKGGHNQLLEGVFVGPSEEL